MTTDDRAAKKAKTLWLKTKLEFTGNWHIDLDDQAIIVNAVAEELSKAYAKGEAMTEQDRAAQKAAELLPEPTCPECKTGVLRPHCFLDLSTTECPRHAIARNLRSKRSAVAAKLREAYAEIDELNKRIATEYVRGREHEQAARDAVHVPHIEQLKAEIARLRAALQKAAGFKVDRCSCVFIDDEPTLECGYHQNLRAELAKVKP